MKTKRLTCHGIIFQQRAPVSSAGSSSFSISPNRLKKLTQSLLSEKISLTSLQYANDNKSVTYVCVYC